MMIKGEGSQEQVIAVNVRKLVQEKKRQEGASSSVGNIKSFITSVPDSIILRVKPSLVAIDRTKKLGVGTYAEVFEGTYLGTKVAVKCFNNDDEKCIKAYRTELDVLSWLRQHGSHPSLVHIYGGYQDSKQSYMILELSRFGNAYDHMRRNRGKTSLRTKLTWALHIAQGLNYLHAAEAHEGSIALHRDIKAENILIISEEPHSLAKLCDFR